MARKIRDCDEQMVLMLREFAEEQWDEVVLPY
jgi:hypothetical protein